MANTDRSFGEERHYRPELLIAIHDVGPKFEIEVDRLASMISGILGRPRFAMLVVPDHWGDAPLAKAPAFCRRLRDWSDAGIEMFVHGWFHRDYSVHSGLDRLRAGTMTAGEGEFLGLDREEAARRMTDGKALIEDVIGREAAGFVAPAWLYGPGSRMALLSSGFRLAEDHMRVWSPQTAETVARGPVITWASRSRPRQISSLAFAGLARHALRVLPTVRIAVHPGDTTVPALMASIRRTISAFAMRRSAGRYQDLLDPSAI
jgi:hypothetical protein